jgi:hypothetical protein
VKQFVCTVTEKIESLLQKQARLAVKESVAGADESTLAAQLVGLVRKYFIFLLLSSA